MKPRSTDYGLEFLLAFDGRVHRPGAAVQVDNSVQPGDELQPKPADT